MSTALIAGASGLVGNQLMNHLLKSREYSQIISIGRRKLDLVNSKITQHIIDFEELDTLDIKADVVFCCLGTTIKKAGSKEAFRKVDFLYPKLLAEYALKKGARAFYIITAMGADSKSSIFYNQVKGEIENELKQIPFEQLGIYRPSLLLGERVEQRLAEGIGQSVMRALGFLFVGSLKNYKAITGDKVAEFMLSQSLKSRKGAFVHLSGEMQAQN